MSRTSSTANIPNNSRSNRASTSEGNQRTSRWSPHEDEILLEKVKLYPENLRKAFKETSETLGRSWLACSSRWYNTISKQEGRDSVAFMCVSKTKIGRNRKNIRTNITPEKKNSWSRVWGNIISLFK